MNLMIIGVFFFFTVLVIIVLLVVLMFKENHNRKYFQVGDYRMDGIIGRGGMATIHKARSRSLKREVAVKLLKPEYWNDQELVNKFLQEGVNLAKIYESYPDSPVVKVLEYSLPDSDGLFFIAMEYLPGVDLGKIINSGKKPGLLAVLHIIKEIARALVGSHALQIYHRDVSPENIIIKGKKVTLIDFGIAKQESSKRLTLTGAIMGKPFFMSPEQCALKSVTGKTDVYSLGAVLFYLIEGKPLYNDPNPYEIMRMHQEDSIPEITTPIPSQLKELIERMLSKNPSNRPDAGEVVTLLEKYIGQEMENYKSQGVQNAG